MANRIVTAAVTGETIKLSNKIAGAAGSFNAVSLSLTFDSAWDGTTKKVYFFDVNGGNAVVKVLTADLLTDGAYLVPIPAEPIQYAGEMTLTIKGVELAANGTTAERVMMSATTTMKVLSATVPSSDTTPVEPNATQTEQLQAEIDALTSSIVSIPTNVAAAAESASAAETAKTDAINAKDAAITAKTAAETAKADAVTAKNDAVTAKTAAETAQAGAEAAQSAAETAEGTATIKATEAGESAAAALASKNTAAGSAATAVDSAATAVGAATDAQTAQEAAEDAQSTAEASAASAASSASTATTKAGEASTSATNAATSAADAAQSAQQAAAGQVNSDWNVTDTTSKAFILHKPTIPTVPTNVSAFTNDAGYLTSHQDISGKLDKTGGGSNVTAAFTQAAARANIATGEKLSVLFGKIKKYFADLKTVAFTGAYSDLSGKPTSMTPTAHSHAKADITDLSEPLLPRLTVTAPTGSTVTCAKGSTTLTATEASGTWTFDVPDYGTWTVTATLSGQTATTSVAVDTVKQYSVALAYSHIYGVEWDGTPSTALSRTDDAELFADPSPAVSSGNGSSPFDSLLPWSGMVKETRNSSVMVKIPKFWFKWTKTGSMLKLQIADAAVSGFSVSPAHMDRGDGSGERDYVYVGRYHCGSSAYKSVSGQSPKANITRSAARTAIHNLGTTTWQMDYAMRLTIQMLYLVEYADWNSQAKIGYGCGSMSTPAGMGYTDAMTYHTGTSQANRTTYGLGTQYRWIEGLWDNVYDWMDGCYYNSNGLNIIKNPSNFSDSANGTAVGTPSSGYPSVMSISAISGFEWVMFPTTASGSDSTYVPDSWDFDASSPCLVVGGYYDQGQDLGLFCVNYYGASDASDGVGCRLQELP